MTTPPEGPREPQRERTVDMPRGTGPVATLPIPGNAEFLLYVAVVVLFAIIWAAADEFGAGQFVSAVTIVTAAYLLSRGIAKASRVYEL